MLQLLHGLIFLGFVAASVRQSAANPKCIIRSVFAETHKAQRVVARVMALVPKLFQNCQNITLDLDNSEKL